MTNVIYQAIIPDPNLKPIKRDLYKKAAKTVKRYADNIGSDYMISNTKFFPQYPPHFESFRVLVDPLFDKYDNVLVVDADVFARNTSESMFDLYKGFAACTNRLFAAPEHHARVKKRRKEYSVLKEPLNSGIVLYNKDDRLKLRPHVKREMQRCARIVPGRDQLALNCLARDHFGGFKHIDPKHACYLREEEHKEAILVHVAGRNRDTYFETPEKWHQLFEVS
jgi:hypothetical protein